MDVKTNFADELRDLASAEEFFDYFGVSYDPAEMRVKRLHILQRFHDYLSRQEAGNEPSYEAYRHWLVRAYEDFLHSDAQTEKVFAVFQRSEGSSFMPLSQLLG
jgi:nitrogenase-stabilizing/protective protein